MKTYKTPGERMLPLVGSAAWKKAVLKAIEHPGFKLNINREACRKPPCVSEFDWAGRIVARNASEIKRVAEAKAFLLNISK